MKENHPDERYLMLAEKWLNGTITPDEQAEYAAWYNNHDDAVINIAASRDEVRQKLLHNISKKRSATKIISIRRRVAGIAAVAAFIIGLSGLLYINLNKKNNKNIAKNESTPPPVNDIKPGTAGAILTLADGRVIVLDTAVNGTLASAHDMQINKDNAALSFSGENASEMATAYNLLATPRARQQQLILSDGTHVWLNAESSIRFPGVFAGAKREVEITGEAYFEVAKDRARPFTVKINNARVEVLGTHFNIMAYKNEKVLKTTLVEGSVQFINGSNSLTLKPGQQSQLMENENVRLVKHVDMEQILAWKNGRQVFVGADIELLMRQIERWYNIDVEFVGKIPQRSFTGDIPREANLSEVLRLFEINNIHFKLDALNRRLILMP